LVDPTTVAALAVRSVIPRFVAGLAAGAAAAGVIIALVIGSTPVRVAVGVVIAVALAVAARAALASQASLGMPDEIGWSPWPQLPGDADELPPRSLPHDAAEVPRPRPAQPAAARAAPPRREVPYWLQLTSVGVGIVSGIGGMIIALAK
jgi:hypothetical protein